MPTTNHTISSSDGETLFVGDGRGDAESARNQTHGLFHADVRHLSRWRLTVDGRPLDVLLVDDGEPATRFFLGATAAADRRFSLVRARAVGHGMHEDVRVVNETDAPLELELLVEAAADFASLPGASGLRGRLGGRYELVESGRLVLGCFGGAVLRETWITSSSDDALVTEAGLRFLVRLDPREAWTTCLEVVTAVHALGPAPRRPACSGLVVRKRATWR